MTEVSQQHNHRKPRCKRPQPVLPANSGVAHCANCHGRLRFDLRINPDGSTLGQWVHEPSRRNRS